MNPPSRIRGNGYKFGKAAKPNQANQKTGDYPFAIRPRADLILRKGPDHLVDQVSLRKL